MSIKLAEAFVSVTARDGGFRRSLQGVRQQLASDIQNIQGMVSQLIGIGGAGAVFGGAVKLAADLETAATAFDVIIKDAEKTNKLLAELNEFSDVTPFEPVEVRRAGQQLVQAGIATEDVIGNIKVLGDIAAGAGGDLNELIGAFTKMRAEGKLTGEVEERFLTQRINLRALAAQAGITGTQFVEMRGKGQLTFELINKLLVDATQAGGMFFGSMDRQSQTLNGLFSTLVGRIKAIATAMGGELMGGLKGVLRDAISLATTIQELNVATDGFVARATLATTGVVGLSAALKILGVNIASVSSLFRLALASSGVLLPIAAVGALTVGVVKLFETLKENEKVVLAWREAFLKVQIAAAPILDGIKQAIRSLIPDFTSFKETAIDAIVGAIGIVGEFIADSLEWLQVFYSEWDTTWELIKEIVAQSMLQIRDMLLNLPITAAWAAGRMVKLMMDGLVKLANLAQQVFAKFVETAINIVQRLPELIAKGLAGGVMGVGAIVEAQVNAMKKLLDSAVAGFEGEDLAGQLIVGKDTRQSMERVRSLLGELRKEKDELEQARNRDVARALKPQGKPEAAVAGAAAEVGREVGKAVGDSLAGGFVGFAELSKKLQENAIKKHEEELLKSNKNQEKDGKDANQHLANIEDFMRNNSTVIMAAR